MAPKQDRCITDFFKRFSQPAITRISSEEERSESEPQNAPSAATTKVQSRSATPRFSMPPNRSSSTKNSKPHTIRTDKTRTDDPIPTPISSSPPAYHAPPPRIPRELSPLTSPESSPSPPLRPSTAPEKQHMANPSAIDPSVSSSSLSSLPISSQSSSKRVIRDGMLAVTNSDSDSLDTDSDPLDDIDELIRRKRLKMTPPTTSSETPQRSSDAGRELRSSTRRDRPSIVKTKAGQPPRKKYKFSIASLVASHNKDAQAVQKIHEYEEEYKQEIDTTARLERELKQASDMNAEEFAALLQPDNGDDETKDRVMRAIERNDVLEKKVQYPFFRHADPRTHRSKPFPKLKTSADEWTNSLQNSSVRDELFRAGFAADMARVSALPEEAVQWILSELLQDLEASLAMGYVCALEASFSNTSFTTDEMRKQFLLRTGREDLEPDLFSDLTAMPPPAHQRPYVDAVPLSIEWPCLLLTRLADRINVGERRSWLTVLMLLLVDPQLEQRLDVLSSLQNCIASLLEADAVPEMLGETIESIGQRIRSHIPNPILIRTLISLLPSYMAASHTFKRRLALASFMKSNTYLANDLDDLSTMRMLTLHLHENKAFRISANMDFHKLGARFEMLDVAMGMGFSAFEFYDDEETTKAAHAAPSDEEEEFNSVVDEVVAGLRSIAFNIRDSGAAHMRRTECKTAIEKLTYRLEFAARTRGKAKKGIFGAGEGIRNVMKNFVGRREQGANYGNGTTSSDSV